MTDKQTPPPATPAAAGAPTPAPSAPRPVAPTSAPSAPRPVAPAPAPSAAPSVASAPGASAGVGARTPDSSVAGGPDSGASAAGVRDWWAAVSGAAREAGRRWASTSFAQGAARLWAHPPRWIIPAVSVAVVLVAVLAGYQVLGGAGSGGTPPAAWNSPSIAPSASAPLAPRPSAAPVKRADDLAQVCEGVFYPKSPRYTGRAPHQISIGVTDSLTGPHRRIRAALDIPYSLAKPLRDAWLPSDPAKSQLVACVTLTKSGTPIRKCDTHQLARGVYTLSLYEVATGRRLLKKQLYGDATTCPNAVPVGTAPTIASTVSDKVLYQQLKNFVVASR